MNDNYEAGIRFGEDLFIRFEYDKDSGTIEVTVIDSENTKTGTATLN